MNRWILTEQIEEKYLPIVRDFIKKIDSGNFEEDVLELDLSGTELNPYTLCSLLEKLGYEKEEQTENGWELDFWITMIRSGHEALCVKGCGMTFGLKLSEVEQ